MSNWHEKEYKNRNWDKRIEKKQSIMWENKRGKESEWETIDEEKRWVRKWDEKKLKFERKRKKNVRWERI